MTLPALSPAARLVLLAVDDATTPAEVAAILVRERVVAGDGRDRAAAVLNHLELHGAMRGSSDNARWTVTRRGEKFRDWLLREMADEGKRPTKASDAPKPSPSRSKPAERASTPKAATTEASTDDRIEFVSASGMVVCLKAFRQEKARGDK